MKLFRFWEEAAVLQWMYMNSSTAILRRLDQDIYEEIKDSRDRLSELLQKVPVHEPSVNSVKDEIELLLVYKKAVRDILKGRKVITVKTLLLHTDGQMISVHEGYKSMILQWLQARERRTGCTCPTGVSVIKTARDQPENL
jgi:hypothetical protein